MKDSWSHGDDRRDRGRVVNRGLPQPRRSRSPPARRPEGDREQRGRDRGGNPAHILDYERPRERSRDRGRRSQERAGRPAEELRGRNKGKELLDARRGSDRPNRSENQSPVPVSGRRRTTRSPSSPRSKKSKRYRDRSPPRGNDRSRDRARARVDQRDRGNSPRGPRRLSLDLEEYRSKHNREPEHLDDHAYTSRSKPDKSSRLSHYKDNYRSSHTHTRSPGPRQRRDLYRDDERSGRHSSPPNKGGRPRSPKQDHFISNENSRPSSRHSRGFAGSRRPSPLPDRSRQPRDDNRHPRPPKPGKSKDTNPNNIEVGKRRGSTPTVSGANSVELKSDKMAQRGFYNQGYSPNHQMQAAFPLKPQYNQPPQVDPRQYSQSPQHSHHSFQSSPQVQSPYTTGGGNWSGQQYSPQPQYSQQSQQPSFSPPTGPQGQFYGGTGTQSPSYQNAPTGPMSSSYAQQNNFRGGNRGNYRGNNFNIRGRGRGGQFPNLHWNANSTPSAGRGQHSHSGNVTPQHVSPQQQYPASETVSILSSEAVEDSEDLFRPSKELQVEDKEEKKQKDDEKMPPPSRPPPTGPQSLQNPTKFSFALKASSKNVLAAPKPEISQKLNAAPSRPVAPAHTIPDRPRGPAAMRSIPTEPASARRQEPRDSRPHTTRKVKKTMKRMKERPVLDEEMRKSDSVYYRKTGNESVVGSGTYGKVYKAVHVYTKKLVALKKIRMEGERDGFPVTAVREIKLLQSLRHENVVHLEEVMVEKNDCFMVFEYLSHDLTGLLNHPTFKLDAGHKKHIAKQLFEGLNYLHNRGVLHRDIKAANILVSRDGLLKLADFGLARFYAKRRQLDYTNRVVTIWYRSPELLLGETQYGPAVDIWSAACVLVEIFTRHAIFPGDGGEINQLEKIYAVLGTPSKTEWPGLMDMAWFELLRPTMKLPSIFAERYKDRVPAAAYELLEAMFQYDPAKRPSAGDVLEHPYFMAEEPKPRQATELALLDGDWHEFESKALRKENERKEKERRRQAHQKDAGKPDKERKRGPEEATSERDAKRLQTSAA
ncbi:hypothetical protein BJ878DRAFT_483253 [Calycina marina]|uniref:cyclin-dependent kinase n=1 Tax=Calycina marina TaxID=1763456 RepID=A0A9P8CBN6_9HELO|nr:hypothetical protein BJ878DRAFT_483253 [Calycina marina]